MSSGPVATKTVATPSAEYETSSQRWPLVRALMGGTAAMREAGTTYLPKEEGEGNASYQSRLSRSVLFNGFRKAVKDMAGSVFEKEIVRGQDIASPILPLLDDVDLTGRDLDTFAAQVFFDGMQTGIGFILVDMPPASPGATLADDRIDGRRPYWLHYRAEQVIGWKSALVSGKQVLTQVRLRECVTVPSVDSPYEDVEIHQIRVLDLGRWEIWREVLVDDKLTWVMTGDGKTTDGRGRPLTFIPLAPVYIRRCGFMLGEPPLQDIADLNVAHWQSQSDQRNILHVARVPILFGAGFDDKAKVVIGAGTMVRSDNPEAKLVFVEHSGKAIDAGRNDLKMLEQQMQAMGLMLLINVPGQTATGEMRDDIKEKSTLAMMADALEDALELAMGFSAAFMGLDPASAGSIEVNKDYGIASHGDGDIQWLVTAMVDGALTPEIFVRELVRRDFLARETNVADAVTKIEAIRAQMAAAKAPLRGTQASRPSVPTDSGSTQA